MIDLTKPYIWVKRVAYIKATDQVEVEFSVNGCITITEVSVVVKGEVSCLELFLLCLFSLISSRAVCISFKASSMAGPNFLAIFNTR
mgnify:CR=1 FL=1